MKSADRLRPIELLSPARNLECAKAAIDFGADAVYIGGPCFGARAEACNSLDNIARVIDYAHAFHAKVYVTLNTILADNEIPRAECLARELCRAQADALIVQDLAFLEMNLPIPLHASTQADIRTITKVRFLAQLGFDRVILARELSLNVIRQMRHRGVELEAFVHEPPLRILHTEDARRFIFTASHFPLPLYIFILYIYARA